jgi:hypothetical protein
MALENWSLEQAKQQAAKVQLKSAVGMDYRKLRDLLAVGKWQEADEETKRVMSEVLERGEVNVVENIIDNFSCEDLYTIDQLWVKCSNGKFGFSVQKRIYQSLGGTKREIWNKFIEKVGWKGQDVAYQLKAPSGHLPNVPGGEMVF